MSNGNPNNASTIWPVVTVIVGVLALAAVGWDVALQGRVKKLEERLSQVEHARATAAAPAKAPKAVPTEPPSAPRRRARGAATQPATTQATTKPIPR